MIGLDSEGLSSTEEGQSMVDMAGLKDSNQRGTSGEIAEQLGLYFGIYVGGFKSQLVDQERVGFLSV